MKRGIYSLIIILVFATKAFVAYAQLDSLESLLPEKEGLDKVVLLNKLAYSCWNVSPQKGLAFAQQAYEIAEQIPDKSQMAKALQISGINHWAKSEYELALDYYKKSIKIYEEIDDLRGIASLLSNMGIIYDNLSNYNKALEYDLKALKISEEHNFSEIRSKTLGNIGIVHLALKNFDKAMYYTQAAIDLYKERNETKLLAAPYNTLGQICEEKKDYEGALDNFKRALKINMTNQDKYGATISLYNIGNAEYNQKNYPLALEYFNRSQTLSREIDDKLGVLLAIKSLGLVSKEQGDYRKAISYYDKSLLLAKQLNAVEERLVIYKDYSDLYKTMGNAAQALVFFEQYAYLNDSIYNEKKSKQIAEMQSLYDSEKKEKENELLRKNSKIQVLEISHQTKLRNSFIVLFVVVILFIIVLSSRYRLKRSANKTLSLKNDLIERQKDELIVKNKSLEEQYDKVNQLNAMKDKFFKIISHDLKNPFNSILGFVDLLNTDYFSYNDSERIRMIKELDTSSKFAYELLLNLLTWAQSQTGEIIINKAPLHLKRLIDDTVRLYGRHAITKEIGITVNIPSDLILNLDEKTTMIFMGNLLSNAIKFTPNGGRISINSYEEDDCFKMLILDSGVGMSTETIDKLFCLDKTLSQNGTNNEKGTGLGLLISKEFIEQNGGSISVKSELGKGSEFAITFPKSENVA